MCRFKSGVIFKNRVVLAPDGNESHSGLLESLGIRDDYLSASTLFVRVELTPKNNNKAMPVQDWEYKVDQDIKPDWFRKDPDRYEQKFRMAVEEYIKAKNLIICCGYAWTAIKEDEQGTYYLMDGTLGNFEFGENNNYAISKVRNMLKNSELVKELKMQFGNDLIPTKTNLLSLDGLDDYGEVSGDILAIPTLDLYRDCRKNISNLDQSWWLATPNSTPSGHSSGDVRIVNSYGDVSYDWCDGCRAVRPFFILKSSIFVSENN